MKELFPNNKFMPVTYDLNQRISIKPGQVFIVKPVGVGAHEGNGISVITNVKELIAAKKKILDSKYPKWTEGVISTYITNPLLYECRKFHLRVYLSVSSWGDIKLYHTSKILTAELPYVARDYSNPKIHDTHAKSTDRDMFYPNDMNDPRIGEGISYITDRITEALLKKCEIKPYSESEHAYELLGVDIMFDVDYNPFLIEVNNKIGRGPVKGPNDYFHAFEREILSFEYNNFIVPPFKLVDGYQEKREVIDAYKKDDVSMVACELVNGISNDWNRLIDMIPGNARFHVFNDDESKVTTLRINELVLYQHIYVEYLPIIRKVIDASYYLDDEETYKYKLIQRNGDKVELVRQ